MEHYCTVGEFKKLEKGFHRHCGPTAITNLILTLRDETGMQDLLGAALADFVPVGYKSPETVFRIVAKIGKRRLVYLNMDLFGRFGGTSNLMSEPYIKTCLRRFCLPARLRYLGRLKEEHIERAVRRGSYLFLELMHHPKYGNHHVLCYGARRTEEGWLLRIADGWASRPVEMRLEDLHRVYAIEIIKESPRAD